MTLYAARRLKFWTAVWCLCAAAVPAAAQPADDDLVGLAAAGDEDEPGAFVYVGFRSGFILGNRVLRRVEGGYLHRRRALRMAGRQSEPQATIVGLVETAYEFYARRS